MDRRRFLKGILGVAVAPVVVIKAAACAVNASDSMKKCKKVVGELGNSVWIIQWGGKKTYLVHAKQTDSEGIK